MVSRRLYRKGGAGQDDLPRNHASLLSIKCNTFSMPENTDVWPSSTGITSSLHWDESHCMLNRVNAHHRVRRVTNERFTEAVQIARFMGPISCPSGDDRTQVGPMLATWTLIYGWCHADCSCGRGFCLRLGRLPSWWRLRTSSSEQQRQHNAVQGCYIWKHATMGSCPLPG